MKELPITRLVHEANSCLLGGSDLTSLKVLTEAFVYQIMGLLGLDLVMSYQKLVKILLLGEG